MKVISAPDIKEWNERAVCRYCATEVVVDASDLSHTVQRGDRPGEGDSDLFEWMCPTCEMPATISPPGYVQLLIQKATRKAVRER